ncbi:YciI family protein [Cellulomonas soli]|uniref:YciI family protein n=1 Tax=Cellulomonas soli TaxID=931535 RepID=UPI003F841BF6
MPVYAVTYTYVTDPAALDAVRPEHRAYLGALAESGVALGTGPFVGGEAGALLVLRTSDRASLEAALAGDPFAQHHLISRTDVREWSPVIGPWSAGL